MNKNVGIAVAVGIVIIIGAVIFQIYDSTYQRTTVEEYYEQVDHSDGKSIKTVVYQENPQILHGLIINKDKYLLGENVFIRVVDIPIGLKDSVQFYTPGGLLFADLKFDGDEKSSMKHYFRPGLQRALPNDRDANLCDKDDLIGEWTVIFAGVPDEQLHFEIMDEILPHSEPYFIECNQDSIEIPMQPSLGQ